MSRIKVQRRPYSAVPDDILTDERLWDVLHMASIAARRGGAEPILFGVFHVPRGGRGVRPRLTTLRMVAGSGDQGEPVITIMQIGED